MRFFLGLPRILGLRTGVILGKDDIFEKRSARRPPQEGSFVYVVKGDHRLAKIGVTTNPNARLAALRTASGLPISSEYPSHLSRTSTRASHSGFTSVITSSPQIKPPGGAGW